MAIPEVLQLRLRNGQVIPFVGAGVSRSVRLKGGGAAFPNWRELLQRITSAVQTTPGGEKPAALMQAHLMDPPDYLPAASVARSHLSPEHWASAIKASLGVRLDDVDARTLALSTAIWSLGNFIITTNYDDALSWAGERRFRSKPRQVLIQSSKKELLEAINNDVTMPTVWHIHGHISEPEHMVLDPGGYESVYRPDVAGESRFEAARSVLRTLLAARSLLFVGFSLDDPYFVRQIQSVAAAFDGRGGPHFALLREDEIAQKQTRLQALGVVGVGYPDHGGPLLGVLEEMARVVSDTPSRQGNWEDTSDEGGPLDAEQLRLATSYLAPNLAMSEHDAIADRLRAEALLRVNRPSVIEAALVDARAAQRVVAYTVLQVRPSTRYGRHLASALMREMAIASSDKETRPLWQLLVAIKIAASGGLIDAATLPALSAATEASLAVMENLATQGVDPDGECRGRLHRICSGLGIQERGPLSVATAQRLMRAYAERHHLSLEEGIHEETSATGATAFVRHERDGMGAVYCYSTSDRKGFVAWIRKGIALAYKRHSIIRGELGFPIGREETIEGGAMSRFERGFIVWRSSDYDHVQAFRGIYPDRSDPVGDPLPT